VAKNEAAAKTLKSIFVGKLEDLGAPGSRKFLWAS